MTYDFHPEALAEFESAADFYANRQPGLDLRFIDAVQAAISAACQAPNRWRILQGEIRRVLVHWFPYAVLYVIEPRRIYILAVMHCSRRPGYWKVRVE